MTQELMFKRLIQETGRAINAQVISIYEGKSNSYIILSKRARPVFEDAPFVTHSAYINDAGKAVLISGHYDLNEHSARESFIERSGNLALN